MQRVVVQLHNGEERTYQQADRVVEKDKYSVYIYGEENCVLAILSKGDVKNLITEEVPE